METKGTKEKVVSKVLEYWPRMLGGHFRAEPAGEADRGRHPGFARHEGLAGGPGSLSLSFGNNPRRSPWDSEWRQSSARACWPCSGSRKGGRQPPRRRTTR